MLRSLRVIGALAPLLVLILPASGVRAATGDPDTTFGGDGRVLTEARAGNTFARDALRLDGGDTVSVGDAGGSEGRFYLTRHDRFGDPVPTFGGGDGVESYAFPDHAIVATTIARHDDALLVGGQMVATSGVPREGEMFVMRLSTAGVPDQDFGGGDGVAAVSFGDGTQTNVEDLVVDAVGAITAVGTFRPESGPTRMAVARFTDRGLPDLTFDGDGRVLVAGDRSAAGAATLVPPDKVAIAGHRDAEELGGKRIFRVAQLDANGEPDAGFGEGEGLQEVPFPGDAQAHAITRAGDDGALFVGGGTGTQTLALLRLTPAGQIDEEFAFGGRGQAHGGAGAQIRDLAVDDDGRILAAGRGGAEDGSSRGVLARWTVNGLLDSDFGGDGVVHGPFTTPSGFEALLLESTRAVVAGWAAPDAAAPLQFALGAVQLAGEELPPPAIAVLDASITEGTSPFGPGEGRVRVTLNRASDAPVTFKVSTAAGTAAAGSDFTALTGASHTIPRGETATELVIPIVRDSVDEPDERFTVTLGDISGATPGRTTATVTIRDDDSPPGSTGGFGGPGSTGGSGGAPAVPDPRPVEVPLTGGPPPLTVLTRETTRTASRQPSITGCGGRAVGDGPVSVTFIAGATVRTVTARFTGALLSSLACPQGTEHWSVEPDVALPEGGVRVVAQQTGGSGHRTTQTRTLTTDFTGPTVTLNELPRRLDDASPFFKGRAGGDALGGVTVVISRRQDDGTYRPFAVRDANQRSDGAWRTGSSGLWLPNAPYRVKAVARDDVGNATESVERKVRIEVTPKPPRSDDAAVEGVARQGENLFATGTWRPADQLRLSYAWERCHDREGTDCDTIRGADGSTYHLTYRDVGATIRVVITASNSVGTDVERTDRTREVTGRRRPPFLEPGSRPFIHAPSGLLVDEHVVGHPGSWDGTARIGHRYAWKRCVARVLCSTVGEQRRYRIAPDDRDHRLELHVTAFNVAGEQLERSVQTVEIAADRVTQRREEIQRSYLKVFGRDPEADELAHWTGQPLGEAEMVAEHRAFIRGREDVARGVVHRAYRYVFEKPILAGNPHVDEDVRRLTAEGGSYLELTRSLSERAVDQAFDKIFFWDPTWRKGPEPQRTALVDDAAAQRLFSLERKRGEELWKQVAFSNEEIHGAADASYEEGAPGTADKEPCFGGIGDSCAGAVGISRWAQVSETASGEMIRFRPFTRIDGRRMVYVTLPTAVGSIIHDAVCRSHPKGGWCEQHGENFWKSEAPGRKQGTPGTQEWDKAAFNTATGRAWLEVFGPYPVKEIEQILKGKEGRGHFKFSDDLRTAGSRTRYAEVSKGGIIFGLGSELFGREPWKGTEIASTLRLKAPAGTHLDFSDRSFCASNAFEHEDPQRSVSNWAELAGLYRFVTVRPFGVCALGSTPTRRSQGFLLPKDLRIPTGFAPDYATAPLDSDHGAAQIGRP